MKQTENFFKHADRDPKAKHSFNPEFTTVIILDAVHCYWRITGEQSLLTQAFFLWYMLEYPQAFLLPQEYRALIESGKALIEGIPRSAVKSCYIESILPMLLRRGCNTPNLTETRKNR